MRRSSKSLKAFKREKLLLGIPKNAFILLLLCGIMCVMFKTYELLPGMIILWWIAKWATKKDTSWVEHFENYSKENHIYDSLSRKNVWMKLPKGWGKGLPW